ncbi:MAG: class I SAM-dependent methyltransferase [Acidimicrobiales bacterium]
MDRLDEELDHAAELFRVSEDDARSFLAGFRLAPARGQPDDPFSGSYRDWVFAQYARVSGRESYATANEESTFDVLEALATPYPYSTRSPRVVGEELVARGFIVSSLGLEPPARIVEFGSGWGNLTLDLARMGFEVTAVEIEPRFCQLMVEAPDPVGRVHVVNCGMLEFQAEERFDAALFYESFHHCADHLAMLERLRDVVAPGGRVIWAGEPVAPMPYPWGLRLDGYSVWSVRRHGWLELGFDDRYFARALDRAGFKARRSRLPQGSSLADVIVASR